MMRKAHISAFVQVAPKRAYGLIGGGYMSSGASQSALSASDYWHNKCKRLETDLQNACIDKIIQLIIQETGNCHMPLHIRLLFLKSDSEFVLAEAHDHIAIEINYDQQYIRVCEPSVLFPV